MLKSHNAKSFTAWGSAGKEHIALAEKLIAEPPKERFDRVILDKKIGQPRQAPQVSASLGQTVREQDQLVDEKYALWQKSSAAKKTKDKHEKEFLKADKKLQSMFAKFTTAKGHRGDDFGD